MATNLKPFCSKRSMILPTSPRWTPSGLTMIKVRSVLPAIALDIKEKNAKIVAIMNKIFLLLLLLVLAASPANDDDKNDVLEILCIGISFIVNTAN